MYLFIPIYRALQEAQDIFGVDFDFEEFEKYDEDYEEDEEEEDQEVRTGSVSMVKPVWKQDLKFAIIIVALKMSLNVRYIRNCNFLCTP